MSERAETLRQNARADAAARMRRLGSARSTGHTVPLDLPNIPKVPRPVAGETTCPRCGTRSSVGCKHMRRL